MKLNTDDHLLLSHHDLQETPLSNVDFSWFAASFYLKGDNGKYCAGYVILILSDVTEVAFLPLATIACTHKGLDPSQR